MRSRSTRRTTQDYQRVLTDVFELMLACGLARKEITQVAHRALGKANGDGALFAKETTGYLSIAALVLDAWHRDRRYLTRKAQPKAIPLFGPCPSVESLARSESDHLEPRTLARRLRALGLVVPCAEGKYKPTSSVALLSALDPLAIQHVARSLSMLLDTIRQNLAFLKPSQRLIERIAEVPDLPADQVPAFRRFTQMQGHVLLRTVNDWLESRRARSPKKSRRTVAAGMHVHSYIGSVAQRGRSARK
jgi:hypothetical protein